MSVPRPGLRLGHSLTHPDALRHCEQSEAIQTKPLPLSVRPDGLAAIRKVHKEPAQPIDLGRKRVVEPFRWLHRNGRPQRANRAAVR
jgi:hypothetical protein